LTDTKYHGIKGKRNKVIDTLISSLYSPLPTGGMNIGRGSIGKGGALGRGEH